MAVTTRSSREFNPNSGRAKKAAKRGPVVITHRGRPLHMLLSIGEYQRLTGRQKTLVDAPAPLDGDEVKFKPPRLCGRLLKAAD